MGWDINKWCRGVSGTLSHIYDEAFAQKNSTAKYLQLFLQKDLS